MIKPTLTTQEREPLIMMVGEICGETYYEVAENHNQVFVSVFRSKEKKAALDFMRNYVPRKMLKMI